MAATSESGSGSGLLNLRTMGMPAAYGGDGDVFPAEDAPATVPMPCAAPGPIGAAQDFAFALDGPGEVRVRVVPPDRVREAMRRLPGHRLLIFQPDGSLAVVETAPPGRRPAGWPPAAVAR